MLRHARACALAAVEAAIVVQSLREKFQGDLHNAVLRPH